jgi:hypothetical protein
LGAPGSADFIGVPDVRRNLKRLEELAQPRCKKYSHRGIPEATRSAYRNIVHRLLSLEHFDGLHGLEPVCLELTPDAQLIFADFYDRNGIQQFEAADDDEAAALAKLESYSLRFALVFALVADPLTIEISKDAMRRGVALAEAFAHEAGRIYGHLGDDVETTELRDLIEWIQRKGGQVSARDLARGPRQYRGDISKAEQALAGLQDAGFGVIQERANDGRGGWTTMVFRLTRRGDGDTCQKTSGKQSECRRHQTEATSERGMATA